VPYSVKTNIESTHLTI